MFREKRRYCRMNTPFIIKIIAYNYNRLNLDYCTLAEGLDISPNGVAFKYPRVIGKNDHLKIIIQDLKGYDGEIIAHIKVMWTERKDILSKKIGSRFLKIATENKYRLMKLIRENGGK